MRPKQRRQTWSGLRAYQNLYKMPRALPVEDAGQLPMVRKVKLAEKPRVWKSFRSFLSDCPGDKVAMLSAEHGHRQLLKRHEPLLNILCILL